MLPIQYGFQGVRFLDVSMDFPPQDPEENTPSYINKVLLYSFSKVPCHKSNLDDIAAQANSL